MILRIPRSPRPIVRSRERASHMRQTIRLLAIVCSLAAPSFAEDEKPAAPKPPTDTAPAAPSDAPAKPADTAAPSDAQAKPADPAAPGDAAKPGDVTKPVEPPAAPAPPPAPRIPAPRMTADGKLLLNLKDVSLDTVLDYLSESAGLIVIRDAKIEGRISLVSRQPLSLDETMSVLNTVLKEKGYAAIRTDRVLRVVTLENAKKANTPVRFGADPTKIPMDDQVVTQVIPIKYADAAQLKKELATLIPGYADLSSNVSSNSLILTDTGANIHRIVEIVHSLDSAISSVSDVKVFPLKYASASTAARLINDIFKPDAQSNSQQSQNPFARIFGRGDRGPGGGGGGNPFNPFGGGGGGDSDSSTRAPQKIIASSDDRTNTVVVAGPPDVLKVIESVLKELDSNPSQDQAVFTYYLKNARAVNAETILNNLFNPGSGTTTRAPSATSPANTPRYQNQQSSSSGFGSSRSGSSGSGGFGSSGSGGFGSGGSSSFGQTNSATGSRFGTTTSTGSATPRLSSGASASASDLAGQVTVVADEDTNSLMVMTNSANFAKVKSVLADLDRPVPQVLIKVLIAEVTHDNNYDLGAEFSAINLPTSGKTTALSNFGNEAAQAAAGGFLFKLVENDVSVAIHALQTQGNLDVLSRPYILASDNQLSSIIVGQEVPFVTDTRTTDTGQTINTIQYQDIGIILNVTPHINPDGIVVMDVAPEISALTDATVKISDTLAAPVFAKRSAQSRVAIRDGQTIVIGGLVEDRKTTTVDKIPLLGDLPIVGVLFGRTQDKKSKTELLIFLTPHVAKEPDRLMKMSDGERGGLKLVPKAVEKGAFKEALRGMSRGADPDADKPPVQIPLRPPAEEPPAPAKP